MLIAFVHSRSCIYHILIIKIKPFKVLQSKSSAEKTLDTAVEEVVVGFNILKKLPLNFSKSNGDLCEAVMQSRELDRVVECLLYQCLCELEL